MILRHAVYLSFTEMFYGVTHQIRILSGDTTGPGVDSVLLACWCELSGVCRVFDAGAGTGILGLIVAERDSEVHVEMMEIDEAAAQVMQMNVEQSKAADRIHCFTGDVMQWGVHTGRRYDMLICNPPYYPDGLASAQQSRRYARQGSGFSWREVPWLASHILHSKGSVSIVIPFLLAFRFIAIANEHGFYVKRRLDVRHNGNSDYNIALMQLSRSLGFTEHNALVLYEDGIKTQAYRTITGDQITICR